MEEKLYLVETKTDDNHYLVIVRDFNTAKSTLLDLLLHTNVKATKSLEDSISEEEINLIISDLNEGYSDIINFYSFELGDYLSLP